MTIFEITMSNALELSTRCLVLVQLNREIDVKYSEMLDEQK